MFSSRMKAATVIAAGAIAIGVAATAATRVMQQEPAPAEVAPGTQIERPQYGPILATEPEVIAEIKALYDSERRAMVGFEAQLDALRAELAALGRSRERFEKQREVGAIRHSMQKTHIEIGLQIARLNENERRVAEFERALDFMNNPERYRPSPFTSIVVTDPHQTGRTFTMKSLRACAFAIGAGAVAVGFTIPASAIEIAEVRGNVYYDADDQVVAVKHVDPPEGDRQPASFLEKYEELEIELPDRGSALVPRVTRDKPSSVLMHDGQIRNQIMVKFREGREVRLRDGRLTERSTIVAEADQLLSVYPAATIQRAFSTSERILNENRIVAERMSGQEMADLNNYYLIMFPAATTEVVDLANALLALDIVEIAYFPSEAAEPAECDDQSPATDDFEGSQNYLDPAPDGVDAGYAWSYHSHGRGHQSFWVADLEWGWCFEHEDIDIDSGDVLNGNTGDARNHGTAVLGILGSCDNGFGTTGITPDVTLKMSDFDSEPSRASNISSAAAMLLPGEVMLLEIHISGPDTGTTCPCNCDQFEYVPVEWDSASFDAIATATSAGIVVVEAAGNGSVNLDWAVYDGWFASTHNSGAIMVGAADPGTHDVSCFSNFGQTVDAHGYGDWVVSTGYGDLFDQAGCAQDYTETFGGTSSASPMVTGAAASLQCIANGKYGVDLSPSIIRGALRFNGTPQGSPTGENIGPMPNLGQAINYFEPDLQPHVPDGWDYAIVPRATADATGSSAHLEAPALPGGGDTYLNFSTHNSYSLTGTVNETHTGIYSSDESLAFGWCSPLAPLGWAWWGNFSKTLKGGRHTLRTFADQTEVEEEWSEVNNTYTQQFVWTGLPLVQDVPVTRSWDPLPNPFGYVWPDLEGFEGSRETHYWCAFAVAPTSDADDFDVNLHTETPMNNPQQGWGTWVASSASSGDVIDFVVVDGNHGGYGPHYGGVIAFDAANDKIVEFEEDEGTLSVGVNGPFTMESSDLISLHEIIAGEGTELRVHVQWLNGNADYRLSVFNGDDVYHGMWDATWWADDHGPGHDEYLVMTAPNDNWYGVAVSKVASEDVPQSLSYNLIVDEVANLTYFEPPGWYGPVVPRTTDDSTPTYAPLPAELIGNAPATHFNWAGINQGPIDVTTPFHYKFYVDDVWSWWYGSITLPSGQTRIATNTVLDPVYSVVRGGLHHLRSFIDSDEVYPETLEGDNQYTDWFVWSPLILEDGVSHFRAPPPLRNPIGYGPWPSNDGFRTLYAGNQYWTAVATLSTLPGEEYDSAVYLPSVGSRDGFSNPEAYGFRTGGGTAYSLINRNRAGFDDADFASVNFSDGVGELVVQRADAPDLALAFTEMPFVLGPYPIGDGALITMDEFWVDPSLVGIPIPVALHNLAGDADLGIMFFDNDVLYASNIDGFAQADFAGDGADEELTVTFDDSDWYGVVVYKNGVSDLPKDAAYEIYFGETIAVEDAVLMPSVFALEAAHPNPFRAHASVRLDVPASGGHVSIAVFDAGGRRVRTLVDAFRTGGSYDVAWEGVDNVGRRVRPGVYFVRLESPAGRHSQKVVLMN